MASKNIALLVIVKVPECFTGPAEWLAEDVEVMTKFDRVVAVAQLSPRDIDEAQRLDINDDAT